MFIAVLASCTSHEDRVSSSSNVNQYVKSVQGTTYLLTSVRHKGNTYSLEIDTLTKLSTDSIYSLTKLRHDNAYELLTKLQALHNK